MSFVRNFDDAHAFDTGFPGYRAQFLAQFEAALFIHSVIQEGGCGPGLHYHHSDQFYFLLKGSMNLQLGTEQHFVEAGSLVFIPAGLAHRNWNDGPGAESHFEMIVPTPTAGSSLAYMVDTPDDIPEDKRAAGRGYVRALDPTSFHEPLPGFRLQSLADPGSGSLHAVVNYAEVEPGGTTPGLHIHEFDQYYVVLEGEMTVEVALQKHLVRPGSLVVLPAGVPHRQYNSGSAVERHLVVLSPAPSPGLPWDQGVDFVANGEVHTGSNELVFTP
ncbi:MAG: hypothetical protein NVSMB48_00190 [Marmoricola sp.]